EIGTAHVETGNDQANLIADHFVFPAGNGGVSGGDEIPDKAAVAVEFHLVEGAGLVHAIVSDAGVVRDTAAEAVAASTPRTGISRGIAPRRTRGVGRWDGPAAGADQ